MLIVWILLRYKTKRPGVFRCAEKGCRKDFSVTMKTVMERSYIALHKWLQAFHLMSFSKKGVSTHQLHRTLQIGYEAAWFMSHRIRECRWALGASRPWALAASPRKWTRPSLVSVRAQKRSFDSSNIGRCVRVLNFSARNIIGEN